MTNKSKYIKFIYYMKKYGVIKNNEYIKALKKIDIKKENG